MTFKAFVFSLATMTYLGCAAIADNFDAENQQITIKVDKTDDVSTNVVIAVGDDTIRPSRLALQDQTVLEEELAHLPEYIQQKVMKVVKSITTDKDIEIIELTKPCNIKSEENSDACSLVKKVHMIHIIDSHEPQIEFISSHTGQQIAKAIIVLIKHGELSAADKKAIRVALAMN